MTTNEQRAAEVLANNHAENGLVTVWADAAHALAKAGLLSPDLPEPTIYPDGEHSWGEFGDFRYYDGQLGRLDDGIIESASVYELRDLAAAALAAAAHAEREGKK